MGDIWGLELTLKGYNPCSPPNAYVGLEMQGRRHLCPGEYLSHAN